MKIKKRKRKRNRNGREPLGILKHAAVFSELRGWAYPQLYYTYSSVSDCISMHGPL
jgi:hypothetical protein